MIERLFNDQKVEDSKKQTHNYSIQILKLHKNISVERVTKIPSFFAQVVQTEEQLEIHEWQKNIMQFKYLIDKYISALFDKNNKITSVNEFVFLTRSSYVVYWL